MILLGAIVHVVAGQERLHKFVFTSETKLDSVSVAGSFNGWNKDANPMKLDADGRTWTISLKLGEGKYQYKFVKNGSDWITDPKAAKNEDDGNGNTNSVLYIFPPDYGGVASRNDSKIALSAVYHDQLAPYFNLYQCQVQLRVRTRSNDVKKVVASVNGKDASAVEIESDDFYSTWQVSIPWNRKSDLRYSIALTDGPTVKKYSYSVSATKYLPFDTPSWVPKTVIYQIFPDRFENGSSENDPKDLMPWDAKPTYSNRFGFFET